MPTRVWVYTCIFPRSVILKNQKEIFPRAMSIVSAQIMATNIILENEDNNPIEVDRTERVSDLLTGLNFRQVIE